MRKYHKLCIATIFMSFACYNIVAQPKLPQPATNPTPLATDLIKGNITVRNERAINTAKLDFSPAFYENGIVFISSQTPTAKEKVLDERLGSNTMSIFIAKRGDDGKLGKPVGFSSALISTLHEGPLTFDKTNENIYFSRNNNDGKKAKYTEGVARMKVYTAAKKGDSWSEVVELSFNENNSDACHPAISVEGDKMFFSSNRAGGYGGMDLYMSEHLNGAWQKPINMGPKINTAKNEVFPYVYADGTLFYSSDGLPGSGGLDIYYVKINKQNSFDQPFNIGAPFNSDKDDFGFIIDLDMKNGYFASSRAGGLGGDDIYAFNIKQGSLFDNLTEDYNCDKVGPNSRLINVLVYDRQTGKAIPDATVSYMNLDDLSLSELVADNNGKQVQLIKSDGTFALEMVESKMRNKIANYYGKVSITAPKIGNYLISGGKKGYSTEQFTLKTNDVRTEIVLLLNKPTNCLTINGKVKNIKNDGPVSNALINIGDEKGEVVSVPTDELGAFTACLKSGHQYRVYGTKDNFLSNVEAISTKDMENDAEKTINIDFKMEAPVAKKFTVTEGGIFQLKNVYYNFNDANIRPDAATDLDALYEVMLKFSDMEIELASHTDSRGTQPYNIELSQRRATNALQYLVKKGIDAKRIVAKGYGETELRNECRDGVPCSENEHKENRRTEIKVTKSGQAEGKVVTDFFTPDFTK